ncbi:hypothetical protein R5R35_007326 [Gryllus longicercus]
MLGRAARVLMRQKRAAADEGASQLSRCLSVFDLTLLGVGSTLGLGVYVLAGAVARTEAGPAVTLSFLVAAIASAFAGLCYAEFAARVPRAGSAYVYSYVTVGEFVAYIIGWNLILEYVIGTASVARGLSSYIDSLAGGAMENATMEVMPMGVSFLSPFPDFFAFGIVMLLTGVLSLGVKESTILNNLFTGLNIVTVLIVIIAGSLKADAGNWRLVPGEGGVPTDPALVGTGGFMPFGVAGVMAGAAKCFYGFVGFDCVATTGEEAKNPQKSIPLAIVVSLVIIFLAYFGISTVITLMCPYYMQDEKAPLPYVFTQVGWPVIKWIVTTGAVFALCTSLLGAMFPLPRILYAMATDGLLFAWLARIHPRSKTPMLATVASGLLAAIMATIFDVNQLIDMMSIGTLLAYTIVAICVLILRYEEPSYAPSVSGRRPRGAADVLLWALGHLGNLSGAKTPSASSARITKWAICVYTLLCVLVCGVVIHCESHVRAGDARGVLPLVVVGALLLLTLFVVARQPPSSAKLSFKVPFVPVLPALSVLVNIYLMLMLDANTWIRFSLWLLIGFLIYFTYSLQHSEEGKHQARLAAAASGALSDFKAPNGPKRHSIGAKDALPAKF